MGKVLPLIIREAFVRGYVTKHFQGKEFFGHPSGLSVLFLTEMWERFSFYGMRALLILYMTSYLLTDPERAASVFGYTAIEELLTAIRGPMTIQTMSSQIYGLYIGLVYFTPFFGGILADRYLGQYKTVYVGGGLMAIGHFLMASEQAFLLALLFLILGNGCFKPNISTQVGNLYAEGDPRRDRAFGIFYVGINVGALLSPIICGSLGEIVGWHWGFGAAGVGMLLGLVIYYLGSDLVPKDTLMDAHRHGHRPKLTKEERTAVVALAVLMFLNIMFWAVYEQQGNTLQLWATQKTNWNILGIDVPSTWFQSFNPFMIIVFTPLFTVFWAWQSKRGHEPSSVTKMGIGCILCGLAYLFMIGAALAVPGDQRGSLLWLVGTVFVFSIGELYLSPIGLSLVTKVAPRAILNMMMGMWFLSSFFGGLMSGILGGFYSVLSKDHFFIMLAVIGVCTGALFFALRGVIQKGIGKAV